MDNRNKPSQISYGIDSDRSQRQANLSFFSGEFVPTHGQSPAQNLPDSAHPPTIHQPGPTERVRLHPRQRAQAQDEENSDDQIPHLLATKIDD